MATIDRKLCQKHQRYCLNLRQVRQLESNHHNYIQPPLNINTAAARRRQQQQQQQQTQTSFCLCRPQQTETRQNNITTATTIMAASTRAQQQDNSNYNDRLEQMSTGQSTKQRSQQLHNDRCGLIVANSHLTSANDYVGSTCCPLILNHQLSLLLLLKSSQSISPLKQLPSVNASASLPIHHNDQLSATAAYTPANAIGNGTTTLEYCCSKWFNMTPEVSTPQEETTINNTNTNNDMIPHDDTTTTTTTTTTTSNTTTTTTTATTTTSTATIIKMISDHDQGQDYQNSTSKILTISKLSSQQSGTVYQKRIPALFCIVYCLLALLLQQSSPSPSSSSSLINYFIKSTTTTNQLANGQMFMLADAALYGPNDKVTLLDSENFDQEILQFKEPFHHIKMVEFYVAYCKTCKQLTPSMINFAQSITNWRTVLRLGVIDVSDHSNTNVGSRWSISGVPTIKMYPPPSESLVRQLSELDVDNNTNIITIYNQTMQVEHLEDSIGNYIKDFNNLRNDAMRYLGQYVKRAHSLQKLDNIPKTWPNLLPVQEANLMDLCYSHPRPELFLIIDPTPSGETSQRALDIILDLSSSSPFKAVRFVHSKENTLLIKDLIQFKEKQLNKLKQTTTADNGALIKLEDEMNKIQQTLEGTNNQLVLVHVEKEANNNALLTVLSLDQLLSAINKQPARLGPHLRRRKRSTIVSGTGEGDANTVNADLVRAVSHYIKQTYSETEEDLAFVEALKKYDEASKSSGDVSRFEHLLDDYLSKSGQSTPGMISRQQQQQQQQYQYSSQQNRANQPASGIRSSPNPVTIKDKPDMNKAIRYLLFTEIQRQAVYIRELSQQQQQERLDTMVNLVLILKTYFPFDDDSSVQFIHGVYEHLLRQQQQLSLALPNTIFNMTELKIEMKNLELEGKRLPAVRDWQLCKDNGSGIRGYPCGLWRLFHTLVAFEYRKNQLLINQQLQQQQQQIVARDGISNNDQQDEIDTNSPMVKMSVISDNTNKNDAIIEPAINNNNNPSGSTSLSLTVDNAAYNSPPHYPSSIGSSPSGSGNQHAGVLSDRSIAINNELNNNLPPPVLIVMRDYIRFFFSCSECAQNFEEESSDLSVDRIRRQEQNQFSLLWLWRTHNRVNRRLSNDTMTNDPDYPKVAYPTYDLCPDCYTIVPRYINESLGNTKSFDESIEWNEPEVVKFLLNEYTNRPFSSGDLFNSASSQYLMLALIMLVMIPISMLMAYVIVRRHQEKKLRLYSNGTTTTNNNTNNGTTINGNGILDERQL